MNKMLNKVSWGLILSGVFAVNGYCGASAYQDIEADGESAVVKVSELNTFEDVGFLAKNGGKIIFDTDVTLTNIEGANTQCRIFINGSGNTGITVNDGKKLILAPKTETFSGYGLPITNKGTIDISLCTNESGLSAPISGGTLQITKNEADFALMSASLSGVGLSNDVNVQMYYAGEKMITAVDLITKKFIANSTGGTVPTDITFKEGLKNNTDYHITKTAVGGTDDRSTILEVLADTTALNITENKLDVTTAGGAIKDWNALALPAGTYSLQIVSEASGQDLTINGSELISNGDQRACLGKVKLGDDVIKLTASGNNTLFPNLVASNPITLDITGNNELGEGAVVNATGGLVMKKADGADVWETVKLIVKGQLTI